MATRQWYVRQPTPLGPPVVRPSPYHVAGSCARWERRSDCSIVAASLRGRPESLSFVPAFFRTPHLGIFYPAEFF